MSMSTNKVAIQQGTVPVVAIAVDVTDIKARELPGIARRFYVKIVTDGKVQKTAVSTRGNAASWAEVFRFDAHGSSSLKIQVYAKRTIKRDKFIGEIEGTIDSLLAKGATAAITHTLCIYDTDGTRRNIQTVVEFNILQAAKLANIDITGTGDTFAQGEHPLEQAAGAVTSAEEHVLVAKMEDAVLQGKYAFEQMSFAPLSVEASTTVNNNARTTAEMWSPFLDKLKLFTDIMAKFAEVHPYAKMAWSILSAVHKSVLDQIDRDDCIHQLVEVIDDIFTFVKDADEVKNIKSHGKIIALMAQQTTECAYFIRDYAAKGFCALTSPLILFILLGKRTFHNTLNTTVDTSIRRYIDKFKKLKEAFNDRAVLQTEITVSRIFGAVDSLVQENNLSGMPYAEGARFDPSKGCMLGTRKAIIDEVVDWVNRPDGGDVPCIFFLSGVAGSGKSAIAHEVAKLFYEQRRLGSSYCFDRADRVRRHPRNLFSTIALDIADLDPQWKQSLCNRVKGNRSIRASSAPMGQFENFILEPAKALTTIGPIVIVIDALDESGEKSVRKPIIDILAAQAAKLPPNFRVLVTAREEQDIFDSLKDNPNVFYKHMGDIDKNSTNTDISLFIQNQMSGVILDTKWPKDKWCADLLKASGGLFQWGSTACSAICNGRGGLNPTERLTRFISAPSGLDALYLEVLKQAFDTADTTVMSRFRSVMGRVLAAKEPLSVSALSALRPEAEPVGVTKWVLQDLGSLLSGVNQADVPVLALHASFFDFLTDKKRSESYYIDPSPHHRSLTLSLLRVMKADLRFNICSLTTSHLRNDDVPYLDKRVKEAIPTHLSYACRFWADHLLATPYESTILDQLRHLLYNQLLYWLEVLSLIKRVNIASPMLLSMLNWVQNNNEDISSLARDAARFTEAFALPISQSAPHIYLSALPFAPQGSRLRRQFSPQFPRTLSLESGQAVNWPCIINIFEDTSPVLSVAFTPDGKQIASGSYDNSIRVWDAVSGEVVVGPLKGHTNSVRSVAFSPDGKRIGSGSYDNSIRVWDAVSGEVVVGPLKGHTSSVLSVAFSPDGKRIASGSGDSSIRVWDAVNGEVVIGPLNDHTSSVRSVAFSPDGKRIASGSDDHSIRVWDAMSGEVVVVLLNRRTSSVLSVAFSPDGKRIASGSGDSSIRVWDAVSGEVVVGPLNGHTNSVLSVAFSPDGKQIASGSRDHSIRVWDAVNGKVVVGPLNEHTSSVRSVAFSIDGKRIASGSSDHSIRVWDAVSGEVVSPLKGHINSVLSVAFSPESKRIGSGSGDNSIRVWDAVSGEVVVGPLKGHTNSVRSMAFSPDGKWIASGSDDNSIRVWDAESGEVVVGPLNEHTSSVWSVAFSPDGKRIASGSSDHSIRVWNAASGEVFVSPLKGHTSSVRSVDFSPDGKRIVSASGDHSIRVWDAVSGEVVVGPLNGHTSSVLSVAFSPDGKRIASGSDDNSIRVWDSVSGEVVVGPLKGHTNSVRSVAFSPDGKRIASGSDDHSIRVWDAVSGEVVVGPLNGHTSSVFSVAPSSNGEWLASGSYDNSIRVWDVANQLLNSGFVHRKNNISPMTHENIDSGFEDYSALEDGWIINPPSTLLFWVPPSNRLRLCWPRNPVVLNGEFTKLNLRNFMHGESWQQCAYG